jgi:pimeloyl-ACP methyl ester carboxylesterase
MSSNHYTYFLRIFLEALGYKVHGWVNGFNRGYCPEGFKKTETDFLLKSDQAKDKVITIGYSHGGFDARELARIHPKRIAMTITLGTPFADIKGTNIGWLYGLINKYGFENIDPEVLEKLPLPLEVPFVSIYSNDDCVVKSHACHQVGISKAKYENIEIGGSHIGLPFNLKAYQTITLKISGLKSAYSEVAMTQKAMAGGSSF